MFPTIKKTLYISAVFIFYYSLVLTSPKNFVWADYCPSGYPYELSGKCCATMIVGASCVEKLKGEQPKTPACPSANSNFVYSSGEKKGYCCQSQYSTVGSSECINAATSATCSPSGSTNFTYNEASGKCVDAGKNPVFLCLAGETCDTAIGPITIEPTAFINAILKLVMGIVGGIVVIMTILAGYQVMTSSGDPQKLAATKELIVSIITGVVLIVFSLVLLQAIGIDILGLPPLGGGGAVTTGSLLNTPGFR